MRSIARLLALSATVAIICVTMLTCAARFASAQDSAASDRGAATASSNQSVSQPDAKLPPQNVAGCWDSNIEGSLADQLYGPGYGWIGFDQRGRKLLKGRNHSFFEFLFEDGAFFTGPFSSGKVNSAGFTFSLVATGGCKITVVGRLGTDNDVVGAYITNKACKNPKKNYFQGSGTFDLPFDPSGCVYITPP